jgi:hypothetical protein
MRYVLLLLILSGCGMSQAEQRHEAERNAAANVAFHRLDAWQLYYDRVCLAPPDVAWTNWCAHRERDREQQAQWAHENEMQRQRLEAEENERRRESVGAALNAYGNGLRDAGAIQAQQPVRQPTNCTTILIGNIAQTNCN